MKHAISWGVDFVQLREKDLSDLDLLRLTKDAVRLARNTKCKVLVNARIDVAICGGAHGVHLPSTGIEAAELIPHLPRGFLVGASTHSLREARRAASKGAHYLLLGPIFPSLSKIGYGEPLGLRHFHRVCSALPIPIFGLGGIHPDCISRVLGAGACGVAGISLFQKDLRLFSRHNHRL